MAFCANCGRPLAEGEVCNCQPAAEQKKNPKTKLKIILPLIISLAAICCCAMIIIIMLTSKSYKKPLDNLTDALNRHETNLDSLVSAALPDFATSSYNKMVKILKSSDDFEEMYDDVDDALSDMYDGLDDEYGRGWVLKFDSSDKEKISAEDLEDIRSEYEDLYNDYFEDICDEIKDYDKYDYEDFADTLGISTSKAKDLCKILVDLMQQFEKPNVSGGYILTGRFILADSKGKTLEKSDRIELPLIKLNGDWTIDYISLLSSDELDFSDPLWYLDMEDFPYY